MSCPSPDVLRGCLESDQFGREPELVEHIAGCADCQRELNALSEDGQLAAWRDAHRSLEQSMLMDNGYLKLLEAPKSAPLTNRSEATETISTDELHFAPPVINGDLGLLGNYRIVRRLGHGGMAIVFEAVDLRLGRRVAVKVLRPDQLNKRARERFVREAQALAKIKHPGVVDIYDVADPENGPPYFVTELMQGTLRTLIQTGPLEARRAAEIIAAAADGLQSAHDAGLVHRDIKPSNILLNRAETSSGWTPKVSDFGLAKPLETTSLTTQTLGLSGTPAYMSPEQIADPTRVTIATDIYSLGATLYETICGELPFRGPPHAVLNQIVEEELPRPSRFNPHVPRELELICLKAMSREPQSRYSTAAEFSRDLRNWLSGRPIQAKPIGLTATFVRWCRRNRRIAALSFTVAVLMSLLTIGSTTASLIIWSSESALHERTLAAEAAKSAAEKAQQSADEAAAQAIRQRRITLDTLNDLVGNVQTQLERRPDTGQLREALLSKAFEGLQSVTDALEQEQEIDHTMIEAHIKMAAIKTEFGDTTAAMDQSRKAIALAERALERAAKQHDDQSEPNEELLRDLANALSTQFENEFRAYAFEPALATAQRIAEIRRQVCDSKPGDLIAARGLIAIRQRIADLQFRLGRTVEATESFTALADQIDALQASAGSAFDFRRDKAVLLNRLSSLHLMMGDSAKAESLVRTSLGIVTEQLKEDAANVQHRSDMAFTKSRLAQLCSALGRHNEAVAATRETIDLYKALEKDDPNNVQYRTMRAAAYDMLYQMELSSGDLLGAREAELQSLALSMENADRAPDASRPPLMALETVAKIGDSYLREGNLREAIVWFKKSIDLLERAKRTTDYSSQTMQTIESQLPQIVSYLQLAEQGEQACRDALKSQSQIAYSALAALAYCDVVRGQTENVPKRIRELADAQKGTIVSNDFLLLTSRALGRCHQRAGDTDKAELETQILSLIRSSLEIRPSNKQLFADETDLMSVRSLPAFRDLLK